MNEFWQLKKTSRTTSIFRRRTSVERIFVKNSK
jgi:hypothetical protein